MPKIVVDCATKLCIIELLAKFPDGLTRTEISALIGGVDKRTLQYVLDRLPCVYVDRWQQRASGKPEAVWAVPDKPPKPPMPTTRSV